MTALYVIFDEEKMQFSLLSFCENGLAPIMQSTSRQEVSGHLSGLEEIDLEANGRRFGQNTSFRFILVELFRYAS